MIRVLAIIAGIGFLMSVVCITAAIAIGGPDAIAHGAWSWNRGGFGPWSWSMSEDGHRWSGGMWGPMHGQGASVSRDFPWSGGGELVVNAPAEIDYVQSSGPAKLTISAPAEVLDMVRVSGREVTLPGPMPHMARLHVTLSAPGVHKFGLNGAGVLNITGYNQDQLAIDVSGHGQVSAQGQTKQVSLDVSGAGDADFSQLHTAGADIDISGAGKATVGPTDWARVQIAGVGDVNLLTRPPHLETHISGAGRVRLPEVHGGGPEHAV